MKTNLTPSLEDYLETILRLERKNRVARVKEIADNLNVQMPSVSGALKTLKAKGLIIYEKNSYINLSDKGIIIAEYIQSKHSILKDFLANVLKLPKENAEDQACRIEHIINSDTAGRIKKLTEYIKKEHIEKSAAASKKWDEFMSAEK